jgi:hypothetical protein
MAEGARAPLTIVVLGPPGEGKSALLALLLRRDQPPTAADAGRGAPLSLRRVTGELSDSGRRAVVLEVTGTADAGDAALADLAERFTALHAAIAAEGGAHLSLLVRAGSARRAAQPSSDALDLALLRDAVGAPVAVLFTFWNEAAAVADVTAVLGVARREGLTGEFAPTTLSVGPANDAEQARRTRTSAVVATAIVLHDAAEGAVQPAPLDTGLAVLRAGYAAPRAAPRPVLQGGPDTLQGSVASVLAGAPEQTSSARSCVIA